MVVTDKDNLAASISVDNVNYSIDGKSILKDINLSCAVKRVGVVGRNGSGKSTFARLLSGLIKPDNGKVVVSGIDVFADRANAIKTVGILFQNPDHQILFPTVIEEISFGLKQLGLTQTAAEEKSMDVLNHFNKAHWAEAAVHQLSQGQKQLVCLMSVLSMQPKLIILDEPLSGLDIPTTMQITRYLDACDSSLLHISHRADVLENYDIVYWFDEGRLVESGKPNTVLTNYMQRMYQLGESDDISELSP